MPSRAEIMEELAAIRQAIRSFPNGALIEEIESAARLALERRTLQRRLTKLEETGEVKVTGKGRATRYLLAKAPAQPAAPAETAETVIPLSPAAKELQASINKPLQARPPVGYNRAFLDDYEPNVSAYLSAEERRKLAQTGQTSMPERPAGTYAAEILNRLLIDLSWNSSRLEGNTYSLLDTQRLIAFGKAAGGKSATETQMILNHKDAIEFLVNAAADVGFNRYPILNLHALLANNLLPDPQAAGRLRTMGVGLAHSTYEPLGIPQQITECFDLLLAKAGAITDPFEQAFFVMVQLPYLQPFDDVNKRVSRLAANIPLINRNLSPLSFVDVPDQIYIQGMLAVYELNRFDLLKDLFIWAYQRSAARYAVLRQSLGEPDPFRLRHRDSIRALVAGIVTAAMNQEEASKEVAKQAEALPLADRARFIEAVETELLALHEGNFARYRILPAEFERWQHVWSANT